MSPQMPDPRPASARDVEAFWDAYFENRFVALTRDEFACTGFARLLPAGAPAGLADLDEPLQLQEIACARTLLADYDTASDGRFALLPARPPEAAAAVQAMIDGSYPYRAAAPFSRERMAVLVLQGRQMLGDQVTIEGLQDLLAQLVAGPDAALDRLIAALAFLLGELRDASSAQALLAVIRNASGVPFARRVLHFSAVGAAFAAAWKCDAKSITTDLVVLMEDSDSSARQKIASLFERLYSTRELLGLHRFGEAWLTPAFWQERLAPLSHPLLWPRLGATSLFWELRLTTLARLGPAQADLLPLLLADEVGVVRDAAMTRLSSLGGVARPGSVR